MGAPRVAVSLTGSGLGNHWILYRLSWEGERGQWVYNARWSCGGDSMLVSVTQKTNTERFVHGASHLWSLRLLLLYQNYLSQRGVMGSPGMPPLGKFLPISPDRLGVRNGVQVDTGAYS